MPPPIRDPVSARHRGEAPYPPPYHHQQNRPADLPQYQHQHRQPPDPSPDQAPVSAAAYTSLPLTQLPPLTGTAGSAIQSSSGALPRQSFLAAPRLAKPTPVTSSDARVIPTQAPSLLPRIRGAMNSEAPILAPLQSNMPSTLSPLHAQEEKFASVRPNKRSRLSRSITLPMPTHDIPHRPVGTTTTTPVSGLIPNVGGGSDSNCASASDDRALAASRPPHMAGYSVDRMIHTTNSSSPSQGDYSMGQRNNNNETFERTSSVGGLRATRNVDESQSNDWEAVVDMYTTGKGTEDGIALKMITKGDGRRVADRKLLEKRRTIGKTYECLGAERFEAAIGYKIENGVRRKQKMYHVISRCRVVNAMRKAGEKIPSEFDELTLLIDHRIAEKEAIKKEAGKASANRRPSSMTAAQGGASSVAYVAEAMGRLRAVPPSGREGTRVVEPDGEVRVDGMQGVEEAEQRLVRPAIGHAMTARGSGADGNAVSSERDDEIRPGRAADRGRFG